MTAKLTDIKFKLLEPNDHSAFQLIADWYLSEWKISIEKTIERLQTITTASSQFQVLMTVNDLPVATGGLYNHVGLLDKEPRFKIYKNWLAVVYTIPDKRKQGYGALICTHIQTHAKNSGIEKIYLFTDTAERLYMRLGWAELERLPMGTRNVVVMEKDLLKDDCT